MTRNRFLGGVATVAAVVGVLFATAAAASAPLHGTGLSTLVSSSPPSSVREADGNTIIEQDDVRSDVGAFTGTVYEHQRLVIHPDGHINTHADATIVGTYAGCTGTVTQDLQLEGQISAAGVITANFTTTQNPAVNVHGTVSGTTASNTVTFTIDYHC
jgi:hypothetical protein